MMPCSLVQRLEVSEDLVTFVSRHFLICQQALPDLSAGTSCLIRVYSDDGCTNYLKSVGTLLLEYKSLPTRIEACAKSFPC